MPSPLRGPPGPFGTPLKTPQRRAKSAPLRSRFCNISESTEPRLRRSGAFVPSPLRVFITSVALGHSELPCGRGSDPSRSPFEPRAIIRR